MLETTYPVLSVLIFFPILACLGLVLLRRDRWVRWYTLGVTLIELVLALALAASARAQGMDLSGEVEEFLQQKGR